MDPIKISLIGMAVTTLVTATILYIWKPTFIMTVSTNKSQVNRGKLISLSVVLGVLVSIVLYLSKMTPVTSISPVKMGFGKKVADCY